MSRLGTTGYARREGPRCATFPSTRRWPSWPVDWEVADERRRRRADHLPHARRAGGAAVRGGGTLRAPAPHGRAVPGAGCVPGAPGPAPGADPSAAESVGRARTGAGAVDHRGDPDPGSGDRRRVPVRDASGHRQARRDLRQLCELDRVPLHRQLHHRRGDARPSARSTPGLHRAQLRASSGTPPPGSSWPSG